MPFGLAKAPKEYQHRQQGAVVEGLPGVKVMADDVLVHGCGDTTEYILADYGKKRINLIESPKTLNLKVIFKKAETIISVIHEASIAPRKSKTNHRDAKARQSSSETFKIHGLSSLILSDICESLKRLTGKEREWVRQSQRMGLAS